MKLSRIELSGFKSFRERTGLVLDDGITAIVGPNGCGKSNIVDAIRWALGEQRASALRGGQMSDIIFAGSDAAKPVGMADVRLTFEVEPDELPAPWHRASEIVIGRRLYRSGQSVYTINREKARLKDIQVLLLGTGAGNTTYSIISQNTVGFIVTARPSERRALIEEAAGVSRYKHQRSLAERNLSATEDNLTRVADRLEEISKQVVTLRQQAARAERYKILVDEERSLGLDVWMRARSELIRDAAEGREASERLRSEIEARTLRREEEQGALEALKVELFLARKRHEEAIEAALRAEARKQLLEGGVKHASQDAARLTEEREGLERRRRGAARELESVEARHAELSAQVAAHDEAEPDVERSLLEAREARTRLKSRLGEAEAERRKAEGALRAVQSRRAAAEAAAEAAAKARAQLELRQQKLSTRQLENAEAVRNLSSEIRSIERHVGRIERDIADATAELEVEVERRDELAGALEARVKARDDARASLIRLEARHDALAQVAEAVPEDAVGVPLVALLDVPGAQVRALSAALGEDLDASWASESEEIGADAALFALPRNDAPRLPGLDEALHPEIEARVVDPGASALRAWLALRLRDARLVDDAVARWESGERPERGERWVDREGYSVADDGTLRRRGRSHTEGLLERAHERRKLVVEVRERREALEALEGEVTELQEAHRRRAGGAEELEAEIDELRSELEAHRGRVQSARVRLEGAERRRADLEEQAAELDLEAQSLTSAEARSASDELDAEASAFEARLRDADVAIRADREALDGVERRLRELELEQVRRDSAQRAQREGLERARERRDTLRNQLRRLAEERRTLERRSQEQGEALAAQREELEALQASYQELSRGRAQAEVKVAELDARAKSIEAEERERSAALGALEKKRERAALKVERATARLDTLDAQNQERYGLDIEAARAEHRAQPARMLSRSAAADRLASVRESIRAFGDVNTGAVKAYQEARDREAFLLGQRDDLEHAIADLREAIQRIDAQCRVRFQETFDTVNARFQQVFPELFGGGDARLVLTDPDDLLESGVDIVAQPPGKRPQVLSLLSGGEKAMTAAALMMSLFLMRPAPFCILDEVDAPLDDINVGRFCRLLESLSRHSQLLVVTHNRLTMRSADRLYGVTMEQKGVSRLVTVRFEELERGEILDRKAS